MSYDYAIHSDFLVHWTGDDIDAEHQPNWYADDKSTTSSLVDELYLERLRNILRHGLWMTTEPNVTYGNLPLPDTPKVCFTELKLSVSRRHAREYGRLGIGVKRPFLFRRLGRPLCYFGFGETSNDPFLQACGQELRDQRLLHFFKPMNSTKTLNYDLYGESEWRILPFENLLREKRIVDPHVSSNAEALAYLNTLTEQQKTKLRYLVPLDGWFAMLIYPSLSIKNKAQRDTKIVEEIRRIKANPKDHGNQVEDGNWPIEVNLDSCRNF